MAFRTLPDGPLTLMNVTVPACLLGQPGNLVTTNIPIQAGKIGGDGGPAVDMARAMVLPGFVDMHTHLDKGHIWGRAPNPDGTFDGALNTVGTDRAANWTAEDVRARMNFSIKCAYAYGTRAIRTHLDSIPPQDGISFPVFRELREDWAGKIELQAACLVGCDRVEVDGAFVQTADLVAESNGVLGMVTYPVPDLKSRLLYFFGLAAARNLDVDFHVDEIMDPDVETLRMIAETVLETGFDGSVVVGHCCSLSTQDESRAMDTLDLVAKAGINVVSLPMCNLYLQDRHPNRTPRGRGITLVHEMKARGINISFASDNTRDPFYAYGDLDMLEVMRQATRIGHLDHSCDDWTHAFFANPATACGFDAPSLASGAPADLVVFNAREWTELYARPQTDRIVIRNGTQIDARTPDYSELDHLMRTA